jgi:hypothetical protein
MAYPTIVEMIEALESVVRPNCVVYVFPNETAVELDGWVPLELHFKVQKRYIFNKRNWQITNDKGGYILLVSREYETWDRQLRGRFIVKGNVPVEYLRH